MSTLFVSIIGRDCTNGGVTSGKENAVLVLSNPPGYEPRTDAPALVLVVDTSIGFPGPGYLNVSNDRKIERVRAVPLIDGNPVYGGMFGGNFITTSDSRFPYSSPIPVFDRFETREEQRLTE